MLQRLRESTAFDFMLFMLELVGMNPRKQTPLAHFLTFATMFFVYLSIFYDAGALYYDLSFETLSTTAESLPVIYQVSAKILRLKLTIKDLNVLLTMMDGFWPDSRYSELKEEFRMRQSFFSRYYKRFVLLILSTVAIYCVKPLTMAGRVWPVPWQYIVCDINGNLCYLSIYVLFLFLGLLIFISVGAIDGIFVSLTFGICNQLYMVQNGLRTLEPTGLGDDSDLKAFYEIVNHHNYLLECIKKTDVVFNLILFEQLWSSNVSICMGILLLMIDGFPISLDRLLKYTTYLSTFLMEVYIFCHFGQMVRDECDKVASAAAESRWFDSEKPEWRKGVIMVTQMAQNSPNLTVGKILNLNLEAFAMVVKNSLSFLTLIQSVYNF